MRTNKNVMIDYTNHRGERRIRTIRPKKIWFGLSQWHPGEQWILTALDIQEHNHFLKEFAMRNIHNWK